MRLVERERPDWMMSSALPFEAHLVGLAIKRRCGDLPWVAHYGDPWSENPNYRFVWPGREWLQRRVESEVLKRCDYVSATTGQALLSVAKSCQQAREKLLWIPNCYSNVLMRRALGEGKSKAGELSSKLIMCYVGRLAGRPPVHLYDALCLLGSRKPDLLRSLELRFYGTRSEYDPWITKMNRLTPGMARWMGDVGYLQSLIAMNEADVLLVIDAPHSWSPFMTSKLADYYGIGAAVLAITPRASSTEEICRKYGGIVAYPEDTAGLSCILEDLVEERLRSQCVIQGRGDPRRVPDFEAAYVAQRLSDAIMALGKRDRATRSRPPVPPDSPSIADQPGTGHRESISVQSEV
jgi:hypothetical protein